MGSWERDGRHIHEHITLDNYTHSTDVFAREAARMIWEHDPVRPLFLFLPFTAPHWPNQFYQHHADANAHIRSARRREVRNIPSDIMPFEHGAGANHYSSSLLVARHSGDE